MDTSLNSSLLTRSPFTPRSRQSLNSKRVLPASFRKSSRFSVSGKSTQSIQIILSTPYNYVERFGHSLPVIITEALTFADRNTTITSRISKHGYAWVVCGRRLLIWQYRQAINLNDTPSKKNLNQCFELQLPQSDLAHRAELVSVFINSASSTPACIAVSPEGVITYWPAIVHDGVFVEQLVSLHGQECDSLTEVEGLGCVLATTTCSVVLIQALLVSGKHSLKCKNLKVPSGWLGGISRRMSSLIFGPITSDTSSESGIVRVLSVNTASTDSWSVYVLADHKLQKWHLKNDTEELVFLAELNRLIRDSFRGILWENVIGETTEIDTWLLDLQADKDGVIILAAAVNLPISPRVHYAMISLNTNQQPNTVKDILILKITDLYRETSLDYLSFRFFLCGQNAYIFNQKSVTIVKPQEEPDTLDFNTMQDSILAGAVCINTPIFFTRNNNLVAIASNDNDLNLSITAPISPNDTLINENVVVNNLSIYNMDPEEISVTYTDTLGQLKAAIIYHIKNEEQACKEILEEIFPLETIRVPGIDCHLDKIVVTLNRDLIDDIAAEDPRWSNNTPIGLGSSHSMQVIQQLKDKLKAHNLFIKFLKDTSLWNQLSASTMRSTTLATVYILQEFSEKIVAAIALKNYGGSDVFEKALEKTVTNFFDLQPGNGLTYQDIFFREVSRVYLGVQELVNYCEDVAHSTMNPAQSVEIIAESNDIILGMFRKIIKHRHENFLNYKPNDNVLSVAPDYLPWTIASGSEGLFDSLSQMHFLTYNYGILLTSNERLKNELLDHLAVLTDLIVDGRKKHLDSIKGTPLEDIMYKQYCSDRQKFMKPLLQEKDWERASKLAEKHLDFDSLIIICETTNNQRRLDEYLDRFGDNDFPEHVYNWFLKENKQGKLLDMCKQVGKSKNTQKLTSLLSDHPSLSWIQDIFDKNYSQAADSLRGLATNETESLTRQKTMLSLCKLAKLTSGGRISDEYLKNVQSQLDLIAYQEDIPDYVLEHFAYDTAHIRVISSKDLINLYICKEYKEASELEFKKALDLLDYIHDHDFKQEMLLKVWRSALLRDNWNHENLDCPLEIIQNKLFFRIVELALDLNGERWNLLPQLDVLLDDDSLGDLPDNTSFQFLIKAGYENFYKNQNAE